MTWARKKREGPGRPRELTGGYVRIDISVSRWMKEKLDREAENRSQFVRNVLRPILEELDLPERLYPIHWIRVAKRAVGDRVVDILERRGRFRLVRLVKRMREKPVRRLLLQ